jgi:hypothetical protein
MITETTERRLMELQTEWAELIRALIPKIQDDYRAYDDCDNEPDAEPSMLLTIGTDEAFSSWSYQTGDNSFSGGAYGWPVWGVVAIYRDSDPAELAKELGDDIANNLY